MRYLVASLSFVVLFLGLLPLSPLIAGTNKNFGQEDIEHINKGAKQVSRLVAYGWDAFNEHEFKDAEFFFKKALEIMPQNPNALYGLSWTYFKTGQDMHALEKFKILLDKGYRKNECGQAIFYLYLRQGQKEKAKRYLGYLPRKDQKRYKSLLSRRKERKKKSGLHRATNKTPQKTVPSKQLDKFFELAKEKKWQDLVSAFNRLPSSLKYRRDILLVTGWAFYNTGDEKRAEKIFERLLESDSSNEEAAYGLALTCQKLGKEACMVSLYNRFPNSGRIKNLYCLYLGTKLSALYHSEYYQHLLDTFKLFLSASCPDKTGKNTELAAWAALKEQNYQLSARLFEKLMGNGQARDSVYQGLWASYQHIGNESTIWKLAETLSNSTLSTNKKLAADFYYSKDLVARAAHVLGPSHAIYSNADAISLEGAYEYTYLDGDKGTSRLIIQKLPVFSLELLSLDKLRLSMGIANLLLQSGATGDHPWIGTPLLGIQTSSAQTSVDAIVPYLAFDLQDQLRIIGRLSTTPIGGHISSVPIFDLSLKKTGHESMFRIFQNPVTRSILSWTGQQDPYTGKDWGRVLETGASASTSFGLSKNWWLSLKGQYGHLWGKDTLHNTKILAGLSIGSSLKNSHLSQGSYGIFATVMHFDRNTDFYTFGHGGYFSPQFFVATGPFCHATTPEGKKWLLDASLSLAYLDFYEKSSSMYPLSKNLTGSYSSDHSSKIGFSVKFASACLLTSNIIGKLNFTIDRSGDYIQYQGGIFFTFFLKPRKGILKTDLPNITTIFTD